MLRFLYNSKKLILGTALLCCGTYLLFKQSSVIGRDDSAGSGRRYTPSYSPSQPVNPQPAPSPSPSGSFAQMQAQMLGIIGSYFAQGGQGSPDVMELYSSIQNASSVDQLQRLQGIMANFGFRA